jgi:hypothetical protein
VPSARRRDRLEHIDEGTATVRTHDPDRRDRLIVAVDVVTLVVAMVVTAAVVAVTMLISASAGP